VRSVREGDVAGSGCALADLADLSVTKGKLHGLVWNRIIALLPVEQRAEARLKLAGAVRATS